MSISTAIFKGRLWRERLADQYPHDTRNASAAALLAKLANDVKTLSDTQWASLKPHFNSCPVKWRDAANSTTRVVGFKSRIKDAPTFVDHLLDMLASQNAVHA